MTSGMVAGSSGMARKLVTTVRKTASATLPPAVCTKTMPDEMVVGIRQNKARPTDIALSLKSGTSIKKNPRHGVKSKIDTMPKIHAEYDSVMTIGESVNVSDKRKLN